ncbi:MAG TPA: PDR/VanB family oxidoreductase [Paraburkholderia sp.]|nr:PDR/VanB family oxidoreductase [Paraburkholderia sp.]
MAERLTHADGIVGFELASADGTPLPAFEPGAHVDVHLPDGAIRQYSLYDADAIDGLYRIAVLRDPAGRGGSAWLHDRVAVGDVLVISPPKNRFALDHSAARSLLFAGGIGITPLLSMAARLHALGETFEVHYRTRSRRHTAFADCLIDGPLAPHAHVYHDDDPSHTFDLKRILCDGAREIHLYVCGPQGFMDAVTHAARQRGWLNEQIHFEYFAAPATVAAVVNRGGFELAIASSGQVIHVEPQQSVVDALAGIGVSVPTSCKHGICGTCLVKVLDGEVDHKDFYLTPAEQQRNDLMLACCSRAKSKRLVLDL